MAFTKILIVDDDPDLRQLLKTYLTKHNYDVLLLPDSTQLDKTVARVFKFLCHHRLDFYNAL